jgi:subtilisin family serine protease
MNYLKMKGATMALAMSATLLTAQSDYPRKDWMLLDGKKDKITGMSVTQAYSLLKKRTPVKVIVAVIDSGVDYLHEDLKEIMWVNPGEVPGNGKDDDGNGYADDINGWNFIGGRDGKNVEHDNLELTRLYRDLSKKFEGKNGPFTDVNENKQFELYKSVKLAFEENLSGIKANMNYYGSILNAVKFVKDEIKTRFGLANANSAELGGLTIAQDDSLSKKVVIVQAYLGMGFANDVNELYEGIKGGVDYFQGQLDYNYNVEYDPRNIVGDNYGNSSEKNYGNNDVKGPDASHGTHVSGIIAGKRGNGIGLDGIADNVQIMSIRVVPDGDERDKDVANGIRYAVDNGAKIINMSFGKAWVKDKKVVDDAVRYAESKGVLLVHAAGNENTNIDQAAHYPCRTMEDGSLASNWVEIGAMGYDYDIKAGDEEKPLPKNPKYKIIVGDFSNYGVKFVDVFAPGVDIYSTTPENTYAFFDGTSMAAPATSGVAAVLLSYFPNLTPTQVRDILMNSSVKPKKYKVLKPGTTDEMVPLTDLSGSGGIVNLYNAIKMAMKIKKP